MNFNVEFAKKNLHEMFRYTEMNRKFKKSHKNKINKNGFVYFVKNNFGQIKIGWAVDPIERIKTLQTGSAQPLFLIGCIYGTRKDEGNMHRMFKAYHINGEWFSYDENILQFIKERDCRNERRID